jgi:hypothetical protein
MELWLDVTNNNIGENNNLEEDLIEVKILPKHFIDENYFARMDKHSLIHISKYNLNMSDLLWYSDWLPHNFNV